MVGVELTLPNGQPATQLALDAIKKLLHRGYIFLPEGEHGNIISFTPPLTISRAQLTPPCGRWRKFWAKAQFDPAPRPLKGDSAHGKIPQLGGRRAGKTLRRPRACHREKDRLKLGLKPVAVFALRKRRRRAQRQATEPCVSRQPRHAPK
jgi:hypothetical protein